MTFKSWGKINFKFWILKIWNAYPKITSHLIFVVSTLGAWANFVLRRRHPCALSVWARRHFWTDGPWSASCLCKEVNQISILVGTIRVFSAPAGLEPRTSSGPLFGNRKPVPQYQQIFKFMWKCSMDWEFSGSI